MFLDQTSLLTAIGFSAAALMVTLFLNWLSSRADNYLLSWSGSMAFVVPGVLLYTLSGRHYDNLVQFGSFAFMLTGFVLVHMGATQFRTGRAHLWTALACWVVSVGACGLAFLGGWSGTGTIVFNFATAILLMLSAAEYWRGRAENAAPMIGNAILYAITAISFVLCGMVLLVGGEFVLYAPPTNWAEDISSIIVIIGLTGIGAVSVTLNQSRAARHHRHEAMTDPLTGLVNRRALFDRFEGRTVPPGVAVIMLDLDHFKAINDKRGHGVGDLVLKHFSEIVREHTRAIDTAARLGGEEFCVVLQHLSSRPAAQVAEQIRAAFAEASTPGVNPPVTATVSAGLAVSTGEGEEFEALLRRADDALYTAKSEGRNRVHLAKLRLVA